LAKLESLLPPTAIATGKSIRAISTCGELTLGKR
jgi:hypothetical protein